MTDQQANITQEIEEVTTAVIETAANPNLSNILNDAKIGYKLMEKLVTLHPDVISHLKSLFKL